MNRGQIAKSQAKAGWDKRAWIASLVLPGVAVMIALASQLWQIEFSFNPSFVHRAVVASSILSQILGYGSGAVVTALAKRRTFLWGFLPTGIFVVLLIVLNYQTLQRFWDDLADYPAFILWNMLFYTVIGSGPVALLRLAIRLYRKRADHRTPENTGAVVTAIQEKQDGVWPPPPMDQGPVQ